MLTLGTVRLGLIVLGAVAALAGCYVLFDTIGDLREAQVRAKIDKAIAITNQATDAANEADAETLALAEKLRASALTAALRLPKQPQCALTADEADKLGKIQ